MVDLPRWKFEAHIGFMPSYGSYLSAYQNAVDTLFDQISSGEAAVDTLSLPFLFMVRHSLEIGYKMNINYLSEYSGLDDKVNWDRHYLTDLHEAFGRHYDAVSDKFGVEEETDDEFWERHQKVGDLASALNQIDRGSYSFRYPVDTDQNEVFDHGDKVNLLDVKETYDQAMVFLFHTSDILSRYTDYHDRMNDILEREIRSAYRP